MPNRKRKSSRSKRDTWIVLAFAVAVLLIIAALIVYFVATKNAADEGQTASEETVQETAVAEMPFDVPGFTMLENAPCGKLNDKFSVLCVGKYTGAYVEDGTDEPVTDVLAIVVKNISDGLVEYGEITLDCSGTTATFDLTGLPASSCVLVMAKDRAAYQEGMELADLSCAQYAEPSSIVMDFGNDFTVYPSDGVINVENISDKDFQTDVSLFYKNFEYGLFIGGITYRVRFSDGFKAGDVLQSMQKHYSTETSAIMYMSYEQ